MTSRAKQIKGSLTLLLTAMIWGTAFVAQTSAADSVASFTFNGVRAIIGAAVLIVYLSIRAKCTGEPLIPRDKAARKTLFTGGAACGVVLCLAMNLQQLGISCYPAGVAVSGRSGFLTAVYVVLVPVCGLFFHKKVALPVWIAVAAALCGMYLLCLSGGWSGIYLGDVLMLLCALSFTAHILTVDHFGAAVDGVKMSCVQFIVCGVISLAGAFLFESPNLESLRAAWLPLLYAGVMSSGVAYTLQIVGQRDTEPAMASLLMSLESVFAGLGGWVLLHERLSGRELAGCALVFAGVLLAQLPELIGAKKTGAAR